MTLSSTCDEFLNALAECMDLCYDDGMISKVKVYFQLHFLYSTEQWPDHIKVWHHYNLICSINCVIIMSSFTFLHQ